MMAVESQLVTKSLWFPREENPSVLSRALTNHSLRFQAASGDNRPVSKVNLLALGDGADQLVSDLNSQAAIMAALPEFGRQPAHPILASALAEELANEPDCLLEPINFLKPKRTAQAVPVWRSNLRTWGVRAALAGVLLFLVSHAFARHLDFRIRDLQARIEAADVQSATQRNKVEQAQQLARWHASRTNWSETLPHTLLQFPNNERIYLSMIRLEQGDASPASLRFEGLAREIEDAIDLNRKLLQHSDALELQPDRIDHEENDPHYRARFTITATVKAAGVSDPTDAERAK
ncbi:MAG TPA: hypothetical protein DDW52_11960 [Planctomycetaceae bacterium]|nr:hypothetical protein [Planctomycetaceae bacterium]